MMRFEKYDFILIRDGLRKLDEKPPENMAWGCAKTLFVMLSVWALMMFLILLESSIEFRIGRLEKAQGLTFSLRDYILSDGKPEAAK